MEDLIGLYINFQDNVGTVTYTTEQSKGTTTITPELINQIRQIVENAIQPS